MAKLPIDTRLKTEQRIEDGFIDQDIRPYLGISGIGETCLRKMWYSFRWCSFEKITPRQKRLFSRGHREELIIQEDLRRIGIIHHSDQKEVVLGNGHIKGHIDDILENVPDAPKTPHLGEYKTHNDKSFKMLLSKGMKESKPMHYAQMICYMKELKLTRGLYVGVNKNDDTRYYERVREDKEKADFYFDRALSVITSEKPMERLSNNPSWYLCGPKWCHFRDICHSGFEPLKNCRTCKFADIHDGGKWKCSGHKIWLSTGQQILGCERHKFLEGLI